MNLDTAALKNTNKAKLINRVKQPLIAIVLAIFVVGQIVTLAHNFSHHSFVKSSPVKNHETKDCSLCAFSGFGGAAFSSADSYFAIIYLAIFLFFRKNWLIRPYFLTSNLTRAPPVIS